MKIIRECSCEDVIINMINGIAEIIHRDRIENVATKKITKWTDEEWWHWLDGAMECFGMILGQSKADIRVVRMIITKGLYGKHKWAKKFIASYPLEEYQKDGKIEKALRLDQTQGNS